MGNILVNLDAWVPDQAVWNNRILYNAKNVYPGTMGYTPVQDYVSSTSAVDTERVRGAKTFRHSTTALTTIVGTRTKIKKLSGGATAFTDLSDGTYATDSEFGFWSMAQYGTLAVMTNQADNIKKYDIVEAAATVSDLGGSPPRAKHIMTVKDFLVVANTETVPHRVQWSDIFLAEQWGSGLADYQDLPDGGRVMSVLGGEVGYLFQERMIRAMQFTPGADYAFQIDPVDQNRGSAAYQGLVGVGSSGFYLAHDGFFYFNGGASTPIGTDKVDNWFATNAASTSLSRTVAGIDPRKKLIFWSFISNENTDASLNVSIPDKMLIYHWPSKRFAWAQIAISAYADISVAGTTLEAMGNIDTLPYSMDSGVYNSDGIVSSMSVFGADSKMGYLSGANLEATFEVKRLEFFPPMRQYVRGFWPVVDGDGVSMALAPTEAIKDGESYGNYVSQEDSGLIPADSSARMHSFRMKISAGSTFRNARGFYVDAIADGEL